MCMVESLCCSPETVTTLLISYAPIQNKEPQKIKQSENKILQRKEDVCAQGVTCARLKLQDKCFSKGPLGRELDWIGMGKNGRKHRGFSAVHAKGLRCILQ